MKANTYLHTFHEDLLTYKLSRDGTLHAGLKYAIRVLSMHNQIGAEHEQVIGELLQFPDKIPDRFGAFKTLTMARLANV